MAGRDTAQHCPVCWAHLSQTPQTLAQSHFSHTTLLTRSAKRPCLAEVLLCCCGSFSGNVPTAPQVQALPVTTAWQLPPIFILSKYCVICRLHGVSLVIRFQCLYE